MKGKSYKTIIQSSLNLIDGVNIYVVSTTNGVDVLYKVGYSSNMKERLKSYIQSNPFTKIEWVGWINDGETWEKDLHKRFKAFYGNEWYEEESFNKFRHLLEDPTGLYSIKEPLKTPYKKRVRKRRSNYTEEEILARKIEIKNKRSVMMTKMNNDKAITTDRTLLSEIEFWDFSINGKITLKKLADVSGISERTVYSRSKMLKEIIKHKNLGYKGKV